jgi:hypothetical protein
MFILVVVAGCAGSEKAKLVGWCQWVKRVSAARGSPKAKAAVSARFCLNILADNVFKWVGSWHRKIRLVVTVI